MQLFRNRTLFILLPIIMIGSYIGLEMVCPCENALGCVLTSYSCQKPGVDSPQRYLTESPQNAVDLSSKTNDTAVLMERLVQVDKSKTLPETPLQRNTTKDEPIHTGSMLKGRVALKKCLKNSTTTFDENICQPVRLSSTPLPLTAMHSFPGSGSTWIRFLTQQATGLATGSVYCDRDLLAHNYPGEGIADQSVIFIKSHANRAAVRSKEVEKVVILIRNPYNAVLSEYQRQHTKRDKHAGAAKHIDKEDFNRFALKMIPEEWEEQARTWLRKPIPRHVIIYEELVRDTRQEMVSMFTFLNITVSKENLQCMLDHNDVKRYHRDKHADVHTLVTNITITTINNCVDSLLTELKQYCTASIFAQLPELWKL